MRNTSKLRIDIDKYFTPRLARVFIFDNNDPDAYYAIEEGQLTRKELPDPSIEGQLEPAFVIPRHLIDELARAFNDFAIEKNIPIASEARMEGELQAKKEHVQHLHQLSIILANGLSGQQPEKRNEKPEIS